MCVHAINFCAVAKGCGMELKMDNQCAVCMAPVTDEAAILTVGGAGTPRCLCAECEADFDEMTSSLEPDKITDAIVRIGKKMADANVEDRVTFKTATEIMRSAGERAKAIESGSYTDETDGVTEEEAFDEIPEEFRESEEDIAKEEAEAERAKRIDKIVNIICYAVLAAATAAFVYLMGDIFWW